MNSSLLLSCKSRVAPMVVLMYAFFADRKESSTSPRDFMLSRRNPEELFIPLLPERWLFPYEAPLLDDVAPSMKGKYLRKRGLIVGAHPPMMDKLISSTHHISALGVSPKNVNKQYSGDSIGCAATCEINTIEKNLQ